MKGMKRLEQIKLAIDILEGMEESTTESFRIVLITLRQKEKELEKMGKQDISKSF